jgi:hypothetical protein
MVVMMLMMIGVLNDGHLTRCDDDDDAASAADVACLSPSDHGSEFGSCSGDSQIMAEIQA